ncbi:hypothetical protein ZWY2020_027519 [Hordeum vulgare]|nr:hypothetical protein ZWY2020_027519 [Hordeum vulgare]
MEAIRRSLGTRAAWPWLRRRTVRKIIGDISAYKLWKCDYVAAAWALANLSAGEFVIGAGENGSTPISAFPVPSISSSLSEEAEPGRSPRLLKKFSSRNIGFLNSQANQVRSMYRGGLRR